MIIALNFRRRSNKESRDQFRREFIGGFSAGFRGLPPVRERLPVIYALLLTGWEHMQAFSLSTHHLKTRH